MTPPREEEDYLPLSGIQHYAFCPRQWALIHIEGQWAENLLTAEGRLLHTKVDQAQPPEMREDVVTSRGVPLASARLGLSGRADVVEFRACIGTEPGIAIDGRPGRWQPSPVEYKRGRQKPDDRDAVQLCAQGMCLEEMLSVDIREGAIFYGQTRHRERIIFTQALRDRVVTLTEEMHELKAAGVTPPPPVRRSGCTRCSLVDRCLPKLRKCLNVPQYIRAGLAVPEEE